ncbi:MAG: GFA family protein [Burkholderiales bacterium]|nr:MAG: GFA family protein [Burkholderiales bacterium]
MKLEGACHCRAVRFTVESTEPYPYLRCYCSICRKTAGGGGCAINLGADHRTLRVEGKEHLSVYRARMEDGSVSSGRRHFCSRCGSALWLYDPTWPDLVHPHASAIDTPLPTPPAREHIMLGSRAGWAEPELRDGDRSFDAYPDESLAQWHVRNGLSPTDGGD